MKFTHKLCIIFIQINFIYCLPQGAPTSACSSLLPIHGPIKPLLSNPLFQISLENEIIGQSQVLQVEVSGIINDLTLKGLMIQARTQDGQKVGEFILSPQNNLIKTIDCGSASNTITHASTEPKRSVIVEWKAPSNFIGEIIFNSTIAQDYDKFWVGVVSTPVKIVKETQELRNTISTTRVPLQPTYTFTNNAAVNNGNKEDEIYQDCGVTKTCFGVPDKCISTRSCTSFSAVKVEGDQYIFEMRSQSKAAYIATGLSMDDKMGDDSVIECVNESGSVKAYTSYTTAGAGKFDSSRKGVPQNIVKLREGRLENGMIYCQVERPRISSVNSVSFDLSKNKYYLLIASGNALKPFSVDYHDITRASSSEALNLAETSNIVAKSKVLLRAHGCLMISAWIGTTSIAIILARYFKMTWRRSSMCGKDIWFAWHQLLVVLTIVLTVAGFAIIWIELKGWSKANNPHAILGTITTAICLFQGLIGMIRPHPSSRNRPIFNWTHWLCGNAAHIFAVVTIFTSAKLEKAELPTNLVDLIMVVYVIIHVISHIVLSFLGCLSERKDAQKVTSFPMMEMNQSRTQMIANIKQDSAYSGFRKFILAIFIILILAIVVALILLVVLAPIKDLQFDLGFK